MFRLPNGKMIDEENIIEAMKNKNSSRLFLLFFLDTTTGDVKSFQKKPRDNKYLEIPTIPDSVILEWMKEYTDNFINQEDSKFAKKVYTTLKDKDSFDKFKNLLEQSKKGWIHGWVQWHADCVYEKLQEWLFSLPINIEEEFELSDNCSICQAMKEAEKSGRNLSKEELEEAFAQARGAEIKINRPNRTKIRLIN